MYRLGAGHLAVPRVQGLSRAENASRRGTTRVRGLEYRLSSGTVVQTTFLRAQRGEDVVPRVRGAIILRRCGCASA